MPDQLNKQSLINLLIDSPLREPIKINLIDIVNNTSDVDLPKVFPTITKELEIFQKATERRMKLADETIAKLGGTAPVPSSEAQTPPFESGAGAPMSATPTPVPIAPVPDTPSLSVPPLDLPPLPTPSVSEGVVGSTPATPAPAAMPTPAPLGAPAPAPDADEAALAEIQKELDSLKSSAAADAAPAPTPTPAQ